VSEETERPTEPEPSPDPPPDESPFELQPLDVQEKGKDGRWETRHGN
jgi:hypothetical protein